MLNKSIGAIVIVKDSLLGDEKVIPFVFEVDKDSLPLGIKPINEGSNPSSSSLVNVLIPGCDPLPSYIFGIGDSSTEIREIFESIRNKPPLCKMKGLQERIVYRVDVKNVRIEVIDFLSIQQERFDRVLHQFKKDEQMANENRLVDGVEIKIEDEDPPVVAAEIKIEVDDPPVDIVEIKIEDDDPPEETATTINPFETLGHPPTFNKQSNCNRIPYEQEFRPSNSSIFTIPRIDETYRDSGLIHLEGKLPVYLEDYKHAMYELRGVRDPEIIMKKLVRYTFPKHWITGVSLTGRGIDVRQSLICLWNFKFPLLRPFPGPCENGLGETRLKALIEHVLRKANIREYCEDGEKLLRKVLANSMASMRNSVRAKYY